MSAVVLSKLLGHADIETTLNTYTSVLNQYKLEELNKVAESAKDIVNAPVTINLAERNKLVIIGEKYHKESMLKSIILQLSTYHSYDELKLVVMANDRVSDIWEDIKVLPQDKQQ